MRGEKLNPFRGSPGLIGSPPHARGKVTEWENSVPNVGITPACAGKSRLPGQGFQRCWDHPRMRGEKSDTRRSIFALVGSPPHARGKANNQHYRNAFDRITPAYAGKRWTWAAIWSTPQDHPRIRGEKLSLIVMLKSALGSPPHARGKDLESPEKSTFLLCRTSDFI